MKALDYLAIGIFFALLFGIAALCSRRAGRDAKDFFLSGRSMPWWLVGVSMCAASTSTNSANMFTEFIRNSTLGENWKWWAFLLTGMLTVFVYSRLWVRSGAKSDIEFYELRYSGKAAAFLRGFRSLYLGIVFNVITTGLVMLAAIKIGQALFGVDQWTVIAVTSVASVVYSALGGFRGAIYTDFFLFIVIMVGAVVGMHYALNHPAVGGFSAMMAHPAVQAHLSFFPSLDTPDVFVAVFVIPVAIQWWNVWYPGSEPGGGGYIVQRMLSAKSEGHCVGGSILYQVVNYAIRPWPWYLTAFASLIVFPDLASLQKAFPHVNPALVKGDLAYPAMLTFVPSGWLGVVAASMMGALFSTVAAHLSRLLEAVRASRGRRARADRGGTPHDRSPDGPHRGHLAVPDLRRRRVQPDSPDRRRHGAHLPAQVVLDAHQRVERDHGDGGLVPRGGLPAARLSASGRSAARGLAPPPHRDGYHHGGLGGRDARHAADGRREARGVPGEDPREPPRHRLGASRDDRRQRLHLRDDVRERLLDLRTRRARRDDDRRRGGLRPRALPDHAPPQLRATRY